MSPVAPLVVLVAHQAIADALDRRRLQLVAASLQAVQAPDHVQQLRAGVPLSELQQQLGHARIDTTTVYTRLTNAVRRRYADRVEW